MATVLLPRSLLALFPGVERRHELAGRTVDEVLHALDGAAAGMRDRLVEEEGPRLRRHINVFVDGRPADLATPVGPASTVHVIPAVSGG
ncbi:MAG TPA: MoaD/ThiS family protein [Candidatus Limnocylindrales bacterium]